MALSWRAPALAALTAALVAGRRRSRRPRKPPRADAAVRLLPCFSGRALLSPCPRYPLRAPC